MRKPEVNESYTWHSQGEALFLTCNLLDDLDFVSHAFTTRVGGVSTLEPFLSLNFGMFSGDAQVDVWENRRRIASAVGFAAEKMVSARQRHTANIAVVRAEDAGRGSSENHPPFDNVDGLVTDYRELPLTVYGADCTPILVADPVNRAVGAVHAGWRGSVNRAAVSLLQSLTDNFGSRPEDCVVAIGPAIGPCCYEVGEDVIVELQSNFTAASRFYSALKEGKYLLDLWSLNREQVKQAGVREENIACASVCTKCNPEFFFSYRRDGNPVGKQVGLILVK